jgi:hypothetical protein
LEEYGVWQFNLETKLRRICFNVLRKLPRLSDVGCFPNRRSAFLRFLIASLHSSLNHGFPGRKKYGFYLFNVSFIYTTPLTEGVPGVE